MNVRIVPARSLTNADLGAWKGVLARSVDLRSPFFTPEYVLDVAAVRDNVEVAIVDRGVQPMAIAPYTRSGRAATPAGAPFCDFQGIITEDAAQFDIVAFMREAQLSSWMFDHQLTTQPWATRFTYGTTVSPYVDLSEGFESYWRTAPKSVRRVLRQQRRLERDFGPCIVTTTSDDAEAFDCLIKWKTQQYLRTGATNVFAYSWCRPLLERFLAHGGNESFTGQLAVLRAGGRITSVGFELRAGRSVHSLLPSYDPECARYSPGMLLAVLNARRLAGAGITRIDLGKGEEKYKQRLMSGADHLAEGCVDRRPFAGGARRGIRAIRDIVLDSPLRRPARTVARGAARVVPSLRDLFWMRERVR